MSDQFVAEIRIFPFNYPPTGWAFCNGQLMPISQNTALFSLLGTMYGGNGTTTFGLPNLQGYSAMQQGQGPGLSQRDQGEIGGEEKVTLLQTEIPVHTHALHADAIDLADTNEVSPNASLAQSKGGTLYQTTSNVTLGQQALAMAGGGQSHNNLQPYLTVNYCIALQGIYPPRS